MSQKSINNLSLNSLTLNNTEYQGQTAFVYFENVLKTADNGGALLINNSSILSQANSKIISAIDGPLAVPLGVSNPYRIDLFDYNFVCNSQSLCTFSLVADSPLVSIQGLVFNPVDNVLTLTFNNIDTVSINVSSLFINLFNP